MFYDHLLESGVDKDHIITIALDDDLYVKYRNPDELSNYVREKIIDSKMYYVLIDEVQYAISKKELKSSEDVKLNNSG